nr:RNA-dependent RNA polymerase [Sarcosphaera coronaria partitivirus]
MPFNSVRNYLAERLQRVAKEWKFFQSSHQDTDRTQELISDEDTKRSYARLYQPNREEKERMLNTEYSTLVEAMRIDNQSRNQPFELHRPRTPSDIIPESRLPVPGLKLLPLVYHSGHVIHANPYTSRPLQPDEETDNAESYLPGDIDFGPDIDEHLYQLIIQKYPEYLSYINKYCRPAGTTDGTFRDFNKPQVPSEPIDLQRKEHVLKLVFHFLDCTPYRPIHFIDTQYTKTPLVTGTGYHNRFSYKSRAHAKYSHPDEYSDRPTSKGYFYNATYEHARTIIHKIKESGAPFNLYFAPEDQNLSDEQIQQYIDQHNDFFNDYPTLLFTRNHISDREKTLKVRPVYAVDDIFIIIELMLTFPLTVQARKPSCSIMYGLETIRGSNCYLDNLALRFETFFTIDWSGYDQHLPRIITDIYYTDFLRRLIVINQGYAPTYEYPDYPDLTPRLMYEKMDNLLHFLHLWYNNMTFLNIDGFAYRRQYAGVPSGLYNTQYLDSFGNLFLLIDGMIEFGFTDDEILAIILFVLGDDNSGFTNWPLPRLYAFISFLEEYALRRYNMTLSKTKSVITCLRSKIETLGYRCNFGHPARPIDKLVAQLCYPEHGIKFHTMSSRAIGLAYASCMQDKKFYQFCKDVYTMFLPFHRPDERATLQLRRLLAITDNDDVSIFTSDPPSFPTELQISTLFRSYQGPLSYEPKWNYAHFILAPDDLETPIIDNDYVIVPPFPMTMYEYEQIHDIPVRSAPTFING